MEYIKADLKTTIGFSFHKRMDSYKIYHSNSDFYYGKDL